MNPLSWIRKFFIEPIAEECPLNTSYKDFMDEVFDVASRELSLYKARQPFDMPGDYLDGGVHVISGYTGHRKVNKKDVITARVIHGIKNIEVEFGSKTFRLGYGEWQSIQKFIIPTKGNPELCPEKLS